jgi:hypothetical protein
MPRRASATSFGQSKGNRPGRKKGDPTNVGVLPATFRNRMALIASRMRTVNELEKILENRDHAAFMKAMEFVTERGFGKVPSAVDVTSKGEKVSGVVILPSVGDEP